MNTFSAARVTTPLTTPKAMTTPTTNPMTTPNQMTTPNALEALMAQVKALTEQVAKLRERTGKNSVKESQDEALPEVEVNILDVVRTHFGAYGTAIKITDIAKNMKTQRAGVHYHVNKLISKHYLRSIKDAEGGRRVDWICLREAIPLPGEQKVSDKN